jgi:predicted acetyltransferase
MAELRYEGVTEADVPALARILSHAFAGPREGSAEWARKAGLENLRCLRPAGGGEPPATLLRIPMGMYFGGRGVPMVGIAGVGVAPEARGRGAGAALMRAAVQEMGEEGVALSGLYPATQPLYRRVGYEQAGHRFEVRLPVRFVDTRERGMEVRPVTEAETPAVKACFAAFGAAFNGALDRTEYIWGRIRANRDITYHGFAAVGDTGAIEGYVYLSQTRKMDRGRQDLTLSDLAFTTARAGRRLLAFLADFSSMADDIVLYGGPLHPALFLLSEQRYRMDLREHWMLRVCDVPRAMEARGYAPGPRAELHLDIRDELLPKNQGRWTVSVEGGRAAVAKGGRGDLRLDVRALAPLYSGLISARQLRLLGHLEGDDAAVGAADSIFAGPAPWQSDMY